MKWYGIAAIGMAVLGISCSKGTTQQDSATGNKPSISETEATVAVSFDADSAYSYVERQVSFGPRVPGTEAHRKCGEWLVAELQRHGAAVNIQETVLTAFDGTKLPARNIYASFNPQAENRTLLLAHWDCRPWADNDPDEVNHKKPVDGADDGASGVGVILEIARQLGQDKDGKGVDILFVDAEDYGTEGSDESWALGTRYFVQNRPEGFNPQRAVLLDMVGGANSQFRREYFSQQYAPELVDLVWQAAGDAGTGQYFSNDLGGAITDDHLELIKGGIPAIDIIAYSEETGFPPYWHTVNDNMNNISRETLNAVGKTVLTFIKKL